MAWLVGSEGLPVEDWSEAVVFTPGGGKIGSLLGGALDGKLSELAGRMSTGRLVDLEVTQTDALIAELPGAGWAQVLMAPAETLPAELWAKATERDRFALVVDLEGGEIVGSRVFDARNVGDVDDEAREFFDHHPSGSLMTDTRVVSVFDAVPRLVIVGAGPIVDALVSLAPLVGWSAEVTASRDTASGLIAPLSGQDKVVVAAHDLELAGAGLQAALQGSCGYIGSVGSRKMQADRADWLAYRGVTDLERVHGPAGLDIGADSPGEVAVAIVAEAIAASRA